jgi:hypothetical protein
MAGDISDLWPDNVRTPKGWLVTCSDEEREWVGAIAARIVEVGSEPQWVKVVEQHRQKWPDKPTPSTGTLAKHIRRVAEGD